jgi:hypothetical protein
LENGSGEGVTAARTAVLPPYAASDDGASGSRADGLRQGRKMGGGVGEQGRNRDAHESMQRVPDQVEGGNFVGEKLSHKQVICD